MPRCCCGRSGGRTGARAGHGAAAGARRRPRGTGARPGLGGGARPLGRHGIRCGVPRRHGGSGSRVPAMPVPSTGRAPRRRSSGRTGRGPSGPSPSPTSSGAPPNSCPPYAGCCAGIVVVGTLEDAEELVVRAPGADRGDRRRAICWAPTSRTAGPPGRRACWRCRPPSTRPPPSWTNWPCGARSWPRRSGSPAERRKECAAFVEELGERRRAADREKSAVAQQLGRLAGQARGAAGEAERYRRGRGAGAGGARQGRTRRPRSWPNGCRSPRRCRSRRSPTPRYGTGSPPTAPTHGRPRWRPGSRSVRTRSGSRGWPDGPTRSTGPRVPNGRHARVPSSGGRGCGTRPPSPRPSASGARQLLAHVEVSLARAEEERDRGRGRQGPSASRS